MRADCRLLVLALCAALAAAPATAQDTPDTALVKLGPVGITPTFLIRNIGLDDNVFNESVNPKSDFTATVAPGAKVVFQPRRLTLALDEIVEWVYFKKYTTERSTNFGSTVTASLDLDAVRLFGSARGLNTRERLDAEVDARAQRHDTLYTAGASLHVASRTTLTGSVRRARRVFDETDVNNIFRGESLALALNGDSNAVEGAVAFELTPLTSFSMTVADEHDTFDSAPERNSRSLRVTPRFTFTPGGLLTGSASVGYRRFRADSDLLQNFSGPVADVDITATFVGRYRLVTNVTRDLRYSYERSTPYFLQTGLLETLTTMLPAGFDVIVNGGIQRLDYKGLTSATLDPGVDRAHLAGGSVGYRIRQRTRVGFVVEWSDRHSDQAVGRNYQNRRIYGTLSWGTPQ